MHSLAPEQTFAGYRLVRLLGRGAFGEVWEAAGPDNGPVALKFLRLAGSQSYVQAALRELGGVMATARLDHPHVLRTRRGPEQDGFLVIVMELADETLMNRFEHWRGQGRDGIPRDELLGYLRQAAAAIDYLNAQNVLHHDIKPENILLVSGQAKVGDFGLARLVQNTITACEGGWTPAYAAPEFFSKQAVKFASDQYSLAATYCRLRSGRVLFDAQSPVEWVVAHTQHRPELDYLPEEERPAVARALAKEPRERWRNCTEFVDRLEADIRAAEARLAPALQAASTLTEPPTFRDGPADAPGQRKRRFAFGLVMTNALVLVVAGLLAWGLLYIDRERADENQALRHEAGRLRAALQAQEGAHARLREEFELRQAADWEEDYASWLRRVEKRLSGGQIANARNILEACPKALRGQDWAYLMAYAASGARPLLLEDARGTGTVAFSPDSKRLASDDIDGNVRLWDSQTGQTLQVLPSPGPLVRGLGFSQASGRLVAGYEGPIETWVVVWDTASGKKLHEFTVKRRLAWMALGSNGSRLASVSFGSTTVELCSVAAGKEALEYKSEYYFRNNVAFSSDGTCLVADGPSGGVEVWQADDPRKHTTLSPPPLALKNRKTAFASVSGDGKQVAGVQAASDSGGPEGWLTVWTVATSQELLRVKGHWTGPSAFSPDSKRIAVPVPYGVKGWDIATKQERVFIPMSEERIVSLAFSPDGRRLAVATGTAVKVWDLTLFDSLPGRPGGPNGPKQ